MKWYPCNYSGGGTEDKSVTFTRADKRENIASGEKHKTLFGKIAKYFADLKTVAFTGKYDDLSGKPQTMTPSAHRHARADITDFPASMPASDVKAWAKAANKPSYNWNEIGNKPTSMPASDVYSWAKAANKPSYNWNEIGSKPQTFPPSSHSHDYAASNHSHSNYATKNNSELTGITKVTTIASPIYGGSGPGIPKVTTAITANAGQIQFCTLDENSSSPSRIITMQLHFAKRYLAPDYDGSVDLGKDSGRWDNIYASTNVISTSDREVKKEISYIGDTSRENISTYMDDTQLVSLINGLKACVYKFKDNGNRPHHGLIAQDVEELLLKLGIKDHAAFIKSPKTKEIEREEEYTDEDGNKKTRTKTIQEEIPGEYIYGLRYEEFIADIIRFCQILYKKTGTLEKNLQEQQEKTEKLEERIAGLEKIINQGA